MTELFHKPQPSSSTPPDPGLDALAGALQASFRFLRWIMLLVGVLYLGSGFFTIRQDEIGFVMVGGRVRGDGADRILKPGAHWTWPRPFARVVRVPASSKEVRSDDFWYEVPPGREDLAADQLPPPPARLHPKRDGYLLTSDANLFHARLALRYRVSDPESFLFGFLDPSSLLAAELNRAGMLAAAQTPVDEALRTDSETFRKRVEDILRDRAGKLALGIDVERVDLMATPPRQAQEAFQAVIKARLEAGKAVAEASGIAARLANEARGESDLRLAEAQTYRTRVVSETAAQVARFKAVLARYRDNPQIIYSLLRQETVSRALASTGERFILPSGGKGDELRVTIPRQSPSRSEDSTRESGP